MATAFITGGARGVGRAIAVKAAEAGMDVAVCDIAGQVKSSGYGLASESDLMETADAVRSVGRRCEVFSADVRDPRAIGAAIESTVASFGTLDLACANAGVAVLKKSWEMSHEDWHEVLDINLTGAWVLAKYAAQRMIEQSTGSIVFISSAQTRRAKPGASAYNASKFGLLGLMKTMALELRPFQVRVNAVLPGRLDTDMQRVHRLESSGKREASSASDASDKDLIPVEAIADAVLWLSSPASCHVTGAELLVDGGYSLDWRRWVE